MVKHERVVEQLLQVWVEMAFREEFLKRDIAG
jgi:hypothetical protein